MSVDRREVLNSLQSAFDEALPKAKLTLALEDDLIDLGIGSIAALEMAATLEDRYDIRLPEEKLAEMRRVEDFVELVFSMVAPPDDTQGTNPQDPTQSNS